MSRYQSQQHPQLRNGNANGAAYRQRRQSLDDDTTDDVPEFASSYIPSLPTITTSKKQAPPYAYSYKQRHRSSSNSNNQFSDWRLYLQQQYVRLRMASRHIYPALVKAQQRLMQLRPRDILDVRILVVALWALLLLWGERWVFSSNVGGCEWQDWETWVCFSFKAVLRLIAWKEGYDTRSDEGSQHDANYLLNSPRTHRRTTWSSSQTLSLSIRTPTLADHSTLR